jgi:hypothetical protein
MKKYFFIIFFLFGIFGILSLGAAGLKETLGTLKKKLLTIVSALNPGSVNPNIEQAKIYSPTEINSGLVNVNEKTKQNFLLEINNIVNPFNENNDYYFGQVNKEKDFLIKNINERQHPCNLLQDTSKFNSDVKILIENYKIAIKYLEIKKALDFEQKHRMNLEDIFKKLKNIFQTFKNPFTSKKNKKKHEAVNQIIKECSFAISLYTFQDSGWNKKKLSIVEMYEKIKEAEKKVQVIVEEKQTEIFLEVEKEEQQRQYNLQQDINLFQ